MEYRHQYLSNTEEPFYYIERKKEGGKWKFCYKVDDLKQAEYLVKNPLEIEKQLRIYRYGVKFVISFIILLSLFLFLTSCAKKQDSYGESYTGTSVVKIDNCEYIIYSSHNQGNIIHKQNCINHKK